MAVVADGGPSGPDVLPLSAIDQTQVALVGGKGAHLGELSRIGGITVPTGFCVTAHAFGRIMAAAPALAERLDRLSSLAADDRGAIGYLSRHIRRTLQATAVPDGLGSAIALALAQTGEGAAYAVRSSATAEDSPSSSFAGLHDTYLNIVGSDAILDRIKRCWASLFTERALAYGLRTGLDPRSARMAVLVQRMVFPEASGVLFTADPLSSNRKLTVVEATFGLGEALVSGRANPDAYTVRGGEIIAKRIVTKRSVVLAAPHGGTTDDAVSPARRNEPALTDAQILRLALLGRRIEAHFACPQDIEWCLAHGDLHVVQARPLTALFPIPVVDDHANHVYVSVGHGQMMTDPMKPLGLSFFQATARPRMHEAGGRLFVDVTESLAFPESREELLHALGNGDPLIRDALETILARDDFTIPLPSDAPHLARGHGVPPALDEADQTVVTRLIERTRASLATLQRDIRAKSGTALIDFILDDINELKRILFDPDSHLVLRLAMEATWWLNDHLEEWLGEKKVADTLTRSVANNITSEMGLDLLDVADVIRPYPEVVALLQRAKDDSLLDELPTVAGGQEARDALLTYLDTYGMRCVGEIDITRHRWSERPSTLVPLILANIRNFGPGAATQRFEQGRRDALAKERDVLRRLRALPDGPARAEETERMVDRLRTFAGFREYPKYGIVCRYLVYKRALLEEAGRLVQAAVIREPEDVFYLSLEELRDVVGSHRLDYALIGERKRAFAAHQALTPPRVLTSDGECLAGAYRRDDVPAGALAGLPVSAGTVEGRARIISTMADAEVEAGDILVTAWTDPSWSLMFVSIAGLVTEVGGLMTHGAVIAREYGLPAVVGVEQATRLIRDGQRIRVHGTEGYVEILPDGEVERKS